MHEIDNYINIHLSPPEVARKAAARKKRGKRRLS